MKTDDREELEEAYKSGELTAEQYNSALKEAELGCSGCPLRAVGEELYAVSSVGAGDCSAAKASSVIPGKYFFPDSPD